MISSRRIFLDRILDYAGSFPPAQLPLAEAFRNFARYHEGADAWMLGRFVCPAAKLSELSRDCGDLLGSPRRFSFTVLGRGGAKPAEFFAGVRADLADVAAFVKAHAPAVVVDGYEVRLPGSAAEPLRPNQLSSLIGTTAFLLDTEGAGAVTPFFESPSPDRPALLALIQGLHDDRHSSEAGKRRRCGTPGFKLRTGGLEPAAVPSCEVVSLALAACAAAGVHFKATAGLHHPLRHRDAEMKAPMHGFVNVFAAGCLARVHRLDEAAVGAIVAEERPESFVWEETGLRFREWFLTNDDLTAARTQFTSFGSCSFDEPRDDLRRLGWLGS